MKFFTTPASELIFFSSLLEGNFKDHWLKQASANKLHEKVEAPLLLALTFPTNFDWELLVPIKPYSKRFKKELLDKNSFSILINNCILFSKLTPAAKNQILTSCGNSVFLTSLFEKELASKEYLSANAQKLPVSDIALSSTYLGVPFNEAVIEAVSTELGLCTRNFTDRIGKTQQKFILTSFDYKFKSVVTYYPALNVYFISGKENKSIDSNLELEVRDALNKISLLNSDSIQLTSEADYRIANHNTKTISYKDKLNESTFYQRAFTLFSEIEMQEEIKTNEKPEPKPEDLAESIKQAFDINLSFPNTCGSDSRKQALLDKIETPEGVSTLINQLRLRIKESNDPTELDFIQSLLEDVDADYFFFMDGNHNDY